MLHSEESETEFINANRFAFVSVLGGVINLSEIAVVTTRDGVNHSFNNGQYRLRVVDLEHSNLVGKTCQLKGSRSDDRMVIESASKREGRVRCVWQDSDGSVRGKWINPAALDIDEPAQD